MKLRRNTRNEHPFAWQYKPRKTSCSASVKLRRNARSEHPFAWRKQVVNTFFAHHIRRPSPQRVGSRELLKLTLWNYVEMQGANTPIARRQKLRKTSFSASGITTVQRLQQIFPNPSFQTLFESARRTFVKRVYTWYAAEQSPSKARPSETTIRTPPSHRTKARRNARKRLNK
jgi:hypothetical protein